MSGGQTLAHVLFQIDHCAQSHLGREDLRGDLTDPSAAEVMTGTEVRQDRGQTRTHAVCPNVRRDQSPGDVAAAGTAASVALVVGDVGRQLRQLGDLVPTGFWVVRSVFSGQGGLTVSTGVRHEGDDLRESVGRRASSRLRALSGLCPGSAWRWFLVTGLGAWGGLAEGGREELLAFCPRRACSSRTSGGKAASCCCRSARTASRSRQPWQLSLLMLVLEQKEPEELRYGNWESERLQRYKSGSERGCWKSAAR